MEAQFEAQPRPGPAPAVNQEPTPRGREAGAPAGLPGFLHVAAQAHRASVQASLSVSRPDDPQEQEADRVAADVMASPQASPIEVAQPSAAELARDGEPPGGGAGAADGPPADSPAGTPTAGQPLPRSTLALLEPRFGQRFDDVRVHTDTPAGEASRALHARAFTRRDEIYFSPGRYEPASRSGLGLIAHELTHVVQQRCGAGPDVQPALEDDFAGQQETQVTSSGPRPAGRIRVTNQSGVEVHAPYRIYSVDQIPDTHDRLTIRSGRAPSIVGSRPGESLFQAAMRIGETVSIRNLKDFRSSSGNFVNVMIALYDGELHLVGFDTYKITSGSMHTGYVEALEGSSGVGKDLFIGRVARVFLAGGSRMDLELESSEERTVDFHRRLRATVGLAPTTGKYSLNIRQMIQVLASWADASMLTAYQRGALLTLATGTAEPTVSDVQQILLDPLGPGGGSGGTTTGGLPGGTGGGPSGGLQAVGELPVGALPAVSNTLRQLQTNVRTPALLDSAAPLRDPVRVNEIVRLHHGLAQLGGAVYEISVSGQQVTTRQIEARAVTLALPAATTTVATPSLLPVPVAAGGQRSGQTPGTLSLPTPPGQYVTATPPVLNLRPAGSIEVGGTLIPPSATTARAGDLIVIGGRAEWVVADGETRQPIAGIFSGGQLYRIARPGGGNLTIDAGTGRVVPPAFVMIDGRRVPVEPVPTDAPATPAARTGMRGGAVGAVGVGLGLIAVANDILAPLGAALQAQRRTNALAEAEIQFWIQFGGDPTWGMWDWDRREALPWDEAARTGIFVSHRSAYVVDVDVASFQRRLSGQIRDFQDLEVFLDLAGRLGTVVKEGGRYFALANKVDRANRRVYEVTETIDEIRARCIRQSDERMQAELRGLPDSEIGNVFRLKAGANTPVFRSARGGQSLLSDEVYFGLNPWVRTLGRRVGGGGWSWFAHGHYEERVLVAPANGDALRAAQVAAYRVFSPIEDVLQEVRDGGRPIVSESRSESDRLESFVAGPDTASPPRFGVTRYYREPNYPNNWTAAIGELKQFWVDADQLEPLAADRVRSYAAGQTSSTQ